MTQTSNPQTRLRRLVRWGVFCSLIACFICQLFSNTEEIQMKTVNFNVPEGKAISTLKEAARQADVDIVFAGRLLRKVETPAVQGEYAPREVFDLMLAGTLLAVFQHEKSGVYTIRKAAIAEDAIGDSNPVNTTPMNEKKRNIRNLLKGLLAIALTSVSASAQDDGEREVYELSPFEVDGSKDEGYRSSASISGTRINTLIKDIPMSLQVIPAELIEDLGAVELDEYIKYAGSVQNDRYTPNGGTFGGYTVRGLKSTTQLVNGFREPGYSGSAHVERTEIIKGPASVAYGVAAPGGLINTITKKPIFSDEATGSVKLGFGSNDFFSGTFDVSKALVKDTLAFRFIAQYLETTGIDQYHEKDRQHFIPSLTWKPNDKFQVNYQYEKWDDFQIPQENVGATPVLDDNSLLVNGQRRLRIAGQDLTDYVLGYYGRTLADPISTVEFQDSLNAATIEEVKTWNVGNPGGGPVINLWDEYKKLGANDDTTLDTIVSQTTGNYTEYFTFGGPGLLNTSTDLSNFSNQINRHTIDAVYFANEDLTFRFNGRQKDRNYEATALGVRDSSQARNNFVARVNGETTEVVAVGVRPDQRNSQLTGEIFRLEMNYNAEFGDNASLKWLVGIEQDHNLEDYYYIRDSLAQKADVVYFDDSGFLAFNDDFVWSGPAMTEHSRNVADRGTNLQSKWSVREFYRNEDETLAYYSTAQLELMDGDLNVLMGARQDEADLDLNDIRNSAHVAGSLEELTYQLGAVYDLTNEISVFAGVSTSFVPNAALDQFGKLLAPETGKGKEIGFKTFLFEDKLSGTISYFDLDRSGASKAISIYDETGNFSHNINTATGVELSQGIDWDFVLSPTPNWQIILNGSHYLKTEVVEELSNPLLVGLSLPNAPEWMHKLWTRYNFSSGVLDGFSVGGGLNYRDSANSTNIINRYFRQTAESWIYDLFFGYNFGGDKLKHSIRLNIKNVEDEQYMARGKAWGTLRELRATWVTRF
jgi:outer membrane receptor protein involved in Fe transport